MCKEDVSFSENMYSCLHYRKWISLQECIKCLNRGESLLIQQAHFPHLCCGNSLVRGMYDPPTTKRRKIFYDFKKLTRPS